MNPDLVVGEGGTDIGPRQRMHWLLAIILLLAIVLGSLRLDAYTAASGDEARFLILAQSLRFEGKYALPGVDEPVPERLYPPGLPILFALSMWLSDSGQPLNTAILPAKIVVFTLGILTLLVLYALLKNYAPLWVVLVTVLAVAVQPLYTDLATEPLTDVPFVFACTLTLLLLHHAGSASPDRGLEGGRASSMPLIWAALAGLTAGMAGNIRLVGGVLLIVGICYLLLLRQWKSVLLFAVIAILAFAPWHLYNAATTSLSEKAGSVAGYVGAVGTVDLYQPDAGAPTPAEYFARIRHHGLAYTAGLSDYLLERPWRRILWDNITAFQGKLDVLFGAMLLLLALPGMLQQVRARQWLLLLYVAGMAAVILLWPFVQPRYVLPLLPFLWFYLFLSFDRLRKLTHGSSRSLATLGIALFVAGSLGLLTLTNLQDGIDRVFRRTAGSVAGYYAFESQQWSHYFEAAQWISDNTPPQTIVSARKPYLVYLYQDRYAIPFVWSSDDEAWLAVLSDQRTEYIIEDAFTWSDATERYLRPVLRSRPEHFELVYETTPPTTRVWHVQPTTP